MVYTTQGFVHRPVFQKMFQNLLEPLEYRTMDKTKKKKKQ
jgi:hypothetical protein